MDAMFEASPELFFVIASVLFVLTFVFCSVMPFVVVIKMILRYHRKKNEDMMRATNWSLEQKERQLELDELAYSKKKIVRCDFCGRQERYNNGICSYCGADLPKPD